MRKQKQRDKLPFDYYTTEELMTVRDIFYHPVRRTDEGIIRLELDQEGDFYSVYGHFPEGDKIGPSMCLYDCKTEKQALRFVDKVKNIRYYYTSLKEATMTKGDTFQIVTIKGKSKWLTVNNDSITALKIWTKTLRL